MPTQLAGWKAIQKGRLKGLSLRAIALELGISRVTVRKYACTITVARRNRVPQPISFVRPFLNVLLLKSQLAAGGIA